MEFDEQDDPHEEMEIPTAPPGYDSSAGAAAGRGVKSEVIGGGGASSNARKNASVAVRYRECQKNHAVSIGGHAVDGCCEFMAAGDEGSLDALKCAACNCHRNFHRQEIISADSPSSQDHHNYFYHPHHHRHHHPHHHQSFPGYYRSPPPAPSGYLHVRPLALPGVSGGGRDEGEELLSNPSSSGGGGGSGSSSKKRFRTKFTQEQKEKMLAFAESVGWRVQKHDEAAVEQFCAETGVRRQVLKVWMHNNKHTLGKKP